MGNLLGIGRQSKEIRVFYIQDKSDCVFAIPWPDTFKELRLELKSIYPKRRIPKTLFVDDAGQENICVCNETTFQGIVPKYGKKRDSDIVVYYVGIDVDWKN